jgi:hypothetical protein
MLYLDIIENKFEQSEYFRYISNKIYKLLYKMISPNRINEINEINKINEINEINEINSNKINPFNIKNKYRNLNLKEKRYSTLSHVISDLNLIIEEVK